MQVSASTFGQRISMNHKNVLLKHVLKEIRKQSGYNVLYEGKAFQKNQKVTVSVTAASIEEALELTLKGLDLKYEITGKSISIIADKKPVIEPIIEQFPDIDIKGKVLDENGEPLADATVSVSGTNKIVKTDQNGIFQLRNLDEKTVLSVSHVGYIRQEIKAKDLGNSGVISMKLASTDLDQVQIQAYGTTTKRLNTGSISTITSAEIEKNPVPNVLQAIQNRVPGLQIIQNTGQVGGAFTVRVRGLNGLNMMDPLYVVDGVPYPAGGLNYNPNGQPGGLPTLSNNRGSGTLSQRGGNALNYINPEDIESINVLKDADATSIYGSRGAFGVILITTKRAKAGKPKLAVTVNQALTMPSTFTELLNTQDYLMLRREGKANDGRALTIEDLDLNGTYPEDAYTNWAKELTGKAANTTRINTTYSGGSDMTSFSISGNYNDQGNVMRKKGYNRDGSLNLQFHNTTPNQKFSLDLSALYSSTVNTMIPYEFSGDIAMLRAPNAPSYFYPDGSMNWESGLNPYSYMNTVYKGVTNNLLGSTTLSYRPVKGLTLKLLTGYNLLSGNELRANPTTVFAPNYANKAQESNSSSNQYSIRTWSIEPFATYITDISKGRLAITAGATWQDKLNTQTTITGTGFLADARLNNPSAGTTLTHRYNQYTARYEGYFGSINYNWLNKYIMTLSARYDASTRFSPENRFGLFGSAGLAYIFTEEKWIKENLTFLSFGKLKGSYGVSGGDGITLYQYLSTYSTGPSYLGNSTFINNGLANPNLHWEHTSKFNIGLTLGLLKDRLTLDVDYYNNVNKDLLVPQPISSVTGFTTISQNSPAKTRSNGIELALNSTNISHKNFSWSTNLILTIPKTKLVSYPTGLALSNTNWVVGEPLTNMKVYNYAGVDPQTGVYHYINAAGVKGPFISALTQADRTANVDAAPKYFGSITNTISYKSLSIDFTFSLVNKIGFNYAGRVGHLPGILNQNSTKHALQRWTTPGQVTDVPKASSDFFYSFASMDAFRQSSGAYERLVYSRLQNVNIAYKLSNAFFRKLKIQNMRIILSGQNLLTISKHTDLDPENTTLNALPPLRVFNLGLNFTL